MKDLREFFTSQTWWGKLLGAFFGYLIAGPAGALIGILVGNFFDRGLFAHFSRPHWPYHFEKREAVQKIFFQATFAIMGHIAKSDGRVSKEEIHMAEALMDEMQLNTAKKNQAKKFFNDGKKADFNLTQMLAALHDTCQVNPELLKLFIDIQYRAAQVDGLSEKKIKALDIVFLRLGLAPLHRQYRFYEDFGYQPFGQQQRQQNYKKSSSYTYYKPQEPSANTLLAQAYAMLEITANASSQEVKRAYRKLISKNHPDKLIAQGLPEQMIKMANEKTQKIRKAYEYICTSKGWQH